MDTSQAFVVILISDATGNQYLGDPLAQRPIFASEDEALVNDSRFEPIAVGKTWSLGKDLIKAYLVKLNEMICAN